MTPDEGDQIIEAQVPMSQMAKYSVELRSMTQRSWNIYNEHGSL